MEWRSTGKASSIARSDPPQERPNRGKGTYLHVTKAARSNIVLPFLSIKQCGSQEVAPDKEWLEKRQ